MESWSYGSEQKGFLFSDEVDLSVDPFSRSRKALIGWESKPSYNFEINKLISDGDAVENMEFMDLGVTDLTRKHCHSNASLGAINGEVDCDFNNRVITPSCLVTSNSFYGAQESGSKISSSCMESISQDSTLIDLKLGRLVDCRDVQSGKYLKERSVISSAGPSLTAKKARTTSSCSQTPLCQVYGCNKDLSSSKDYHKRHKVCEVHSKTPKVIVNGNEQRFCQQCSRFHMLSEFDDSKRSCRRRLAGHNERRRKPQFNILSDKSYKLLQSCQGTNFPWTCLPKGTSFVFPKMLPSDIIFPERYEEVNLCNKKQHSLGNPPSATESYRVLNAASTIQQSSGISHSSRALSLLSAESDILSGHSMGILTAKPLINQVSCAHDRELQNFDKMSGLTPMGKCPTEGFYLSGMNYMDVAQTESTMVHDASHAVDLKLETDRVSQESDLLNDKFSWSSEHGCTVDLIQLSSHLKRVEQQRNSMQLKQTGNDLGCFLNS